MASTVYFVKVSDSADEETRTDALRAIFRASGASRRFSRGELVAVKVHVGEKGNVTHVSPGLVAVIVEQVKRKGAFPFLTETSTLYKGKRQNAVKHLLHAHAQGFGIERVGAPFIMADGLAGNTEKEIPIGSGTNRTVGVAREVLVADALLVVSHPTGHIGCGMGGAVKNIGMGLASRMGKMRQHSSIRPEVIESRCQKCGKCRTWCPKDAIIERDGRSFIIEERCIGCGECLAVCRFDAVRYDWGVDSATLQKNMAEHALGAVYGKKGKLMCFNFLIDMTRDCDCVNGRQQKLIPDIGILASEDPVAIDKATLDLTAGIHGKDLGRLAYPAVDPTVQLRHGEKIGLGSMKYTLVELPGSHLQISIKIN